MGAAIGTGVTGPFQDIGAPLVYNKSEVCVDKTLYE